MKYYAVLPIATIFAYRYLAEQLPHRWEGNVNYMSESRSTLYSGCSITLRTKNGLCTDSLSCGRPHPVALLCN